MRPHTQQETIIMAITEEQVIEYLEQLNIVQLNELVKKLEERWDVKAAAGGAVMVAAAGPAEEAAAEPTEFNVILKDFGSKKLQVIKTLRTLTSLGLKEAKNLVDNAPSTIKEAVDKEEAENMKAKLEEVGATIEIKPV